jgi:predicted metalloprotease with PDZ domain
MSEFAVQYQITPIHPEAHLFRVSCVINEPDPAGQRLSMPAWIPGSYMIRDFAKNIIGLTAEVDNQPLALKKLDKSTWQCGPCTGPITLMYEIYAWDLSVRTAHLDTRHAYFNGTSVFLQAHGHEAKRCSIDIHPPAGDNYANWRVATAMSQLKAERYGFGLYQAENYDELVDHPVEMGTFILATFTAGGIPHDIVITGQHRADMKRLCEDLEKICNTHIDLFGELPAIKRYVFLVMVVGDGYGGLEHRASTSLLCNRNDLPLEGEDAVTDNYRTFLGLCSHEYFHTWNVKRIKPAAFTPYDLSQEIHTEQLWAFEGITSYYDDLALVRSGIIEPASYLELLGQTITRVWRGQGRFKQSVAASSFDTWTKFYKQDESAPNTIVSYYTKGSLIALALDLIIQQATNNQKSLDDLMRLLWVKYGKPGKGLAEKEIEALLSQITGQDLTDFFANYLYGTQDLPLDKLLKTVGIDFHLRAASSVDDKGGKPADNSNSKPLITLGARVATDPAGALLTHVFDNGPAQRAGLAAGDIVVALDGIRASKDNLEKSINSYQINDEVTIHAFRRDELYKFSLVLTEAPLDTCYLEINDSVDTQQITARQHWLHQAQSQPS